MTTLREAAQQALEALEYYQHRKLEWDYSDEAAITALRAALAQQDEPVARSLTEDERAAIEYFALNPSMAVLAFSHWLRRDKSAPPPAQAGAADGGGDHAYRHDAPEPASGSPRRRAGAWNRRNPMTDLRTAAQQALEALELVVVDVKTTPTAYEAQRQAIATLRAALAEPAQEPVAWIYQNMYTEQEYLVWKKGTGGRNWRPLYAAPPQREPLTLEEAQTLLKAERIWLSNNTAFRITRAIKRAHGIKE